jgi:hypothetical protein
MNLNNIISTVKIYCISTFFEKKNRIFNILFIFFFCYFIYGVFPFAPYQGDSLGIMMGSKRIIETGVFTAHDLSYGFQMQPGAYFWIVLLNSISGLSVLYCYSIISAFFGILFLFLSIIFLQKITHVSFSICGLILLLFQETYSAWYYCNSAVIAGAFMILALNIILRRNSWIHLLIAGICLGLAAWSRADVIILFPVSLFLVYGKTLREKVLKTAVLAIITLIFTSFLYWTSNLSVLGLISNLSSTQKIFTFAHNTETSLGVFWSALARSYISFFSVLLVFLIFAGIITMLKNKLWLEIVIFFSPILLFLIILKGNITAPKHLFYFIPFFALPVLINIQYFEKLKKKSRKYLIIVAAALFIFQYVFGLQIFFNSHPYIGKNYASVTPNPTYLKILNFKVKRSRVDSVKLVIGGGMKLSTADEMMLSSGILFSPLMWHNLKIQCNEDMDGLEKYINTYSGDSLIIFTTQGSNVYVNYVLSKSNFELKSYSEKLNIWEKTGKKAFVNYAFYPKKIDEYEQLVLSNNLKGSIFVPYWDWEKYFVQNSKLSFTQINNITYYSNK